MDKHLNPRNKMYFICEKKKNLNEPEWIFLLDGRVVGTVSPFGYLKYLWISAIFYCTSWTYYYCVRTLVPRKRLFSALDKICHSEELFLHFKIDSISMRSPRCTLCESGKKKKKRERKLYIRASACARYCTFYTFTVSGALLEGNGFRWKLTHKWIHCRRKLDSKITPQPARARFFYSSVRAIPQIPLDNLNIALDVFWKQLATSLGTF